MARPSAEATPRVVSEAWALLPAVLWASRGLAPSLLLPPPCLRRTSRSGRADAYTGRPVGSALLLLLRLFCPRQLCEMPFSSPF